MALQMKSKKNHYILLEGTLHHCKLTNYFINQLIQIIKKQNKLLISLKVEVDKSSFIFTRSETELSVSRDSFN